MDAGHRCIQQYRISGFTIEKTAEAEIGFNSELQARQADLAKDYITRLAEYLASIAGHSSWTLDAQAVAFDFVVFLDRLWLQWSLGNRDSISAEKVGAYAFFEHHVRPLNELYAM